MRTHIDWLTFSLAVGAPDDTESGYTNALQRALNNGMGEDLCNAVMGFEFKHREGSRAPYVDSWHAGEVGITIFANPTLSHMTVEVSGQGCENLIERGLLNALLEQVQGRVTRIDVACDIETEVTPTTFVAQMAHERMRASGFQKSESGETCYIGSQKSERYARVYRYNPPHPRAHLLRVEHVFRKDYAKSVAKACASAALEDVAQSAGKAFGWAHGAWQPTSTQDVDLSIVAAERAAGKTVYWLVHSAAPAFQRLVADGTIKDPERFVREYFFANLTDA